jgi:hypothetical protein
MPHRSFFHLQYCTPPPPQPPPPHTHTISSSPNITSEVRVSLHHEIQMSRITNSANSISSKTTFFTNAQSAVTFLLCSLHRDSALWLVFRQLSGREIRYWHSQNPVSAFLGNQFFSLKIHMPQVLIYLSALPLHLSPFSFSVFYRKN